MISTNDIKVKDSKKKISPILTTNKLKLPEFDLEKRVFPGVATRKTRKVSGMMTLQNRDDMVKAALPKPKMVAKPKAKKRRGKKRKTRK